MHKLKKLRNKSINMNKIKKYSDNIVSCLNHSED